MATLEDHFVANIRRRMEELEMSQADLANSLGVSAAYVSQVLRGHSELSGLKYVQKFANSLGTTPEKLLENLRDDSDLVALKCIKKFADALNCKPADLLVRKPHTKARHLYKDGRVRSGKYRKVETD